jgi:hypothetical protein
MGGQRKRLSELSAYAESLGFRLVGRTGKGHPKFRHPNGAQTTFSLSPSCPHAERKARRHLRKLADGIRP